MKGFAVLMAPVFWSIRNDIFRLNRSFYRKLIFFGVSSGILLLLFTRLLNIAMTKLQSMSPDLFALLLIKGYSLIFVVVFFLQIVNGFIFSLDAFFQSRDLELLFTSPVKRTLLFFSRLVCVHIKASWMLIIFGIPLLFAAGIFYHASLLYYGAALILFATFSTIPVNVGATLSLIFCNFFHVRRIKTVLLSTGIIATALLITLFRILRPERFVNPELFANLTFFITEMRAPSFILLPNRWLSESLFSFLDRSSPSTALIFIALLFSTSYLTTMFLSLVFKRYHYRGWGLLHEGNFVRIKHSPHLSLTAPCGRKPFLNRVIQGLFLALAKRSGPLLRKDVLCQKRDANVQQLLILFLLVIIYLFSIASLPLNWVGYETQLKYVVSFFNLGLILIIVASLCSRLVYPAVVSEGTFLWILKTSPVTSRRFIWMKFLFFLVPVFLAGQLLTIASSLIIGIETAFIVLQSATTAVLTCSLLAMAVAFGSSDMRLEREGFSGRRSSSESASYLLVSLVLILLTLGLEVAPVFLYFLRESQQSLFTQKAWLVMAGVAFLLFSVNLLVTVFSLRFGIRVIERREG